MAQGPGRYDEVLTRARVECGASSAVLIVFDGVLGAGFASQAPEHVTRLLPQVLRDVADSIERANAARDN